MQIKQALDWGYKKLKNSPSANLDAEIILVESLLCQDRIATYHRACKFEVKNHQIDKSWLIAHSDYELSKSELKKYRELTARRKKLEPVAYITGHKEFYGLDFIMDKNALIPRPQTEIMVERVIKNVKNKKKLIADIGTGSGCIAIALAKNCPHAKIVATDISKKSFDIARKNIAAHQCSKKIRLVHCDLFPKKIIKFDMVAANLPYLPQKKITEDLKYEPRLALLGKGKIGEQIYNSFFKKIKKYLKKNYLICIELEPNQIDKLKRVINFYLNNPKIIIVKDLTGANRFLEITPSSEA